jgi:uncharacterized protein (DUF2236 family)
MGTATILGRVNGERVVVLGWSRAILMQLAHPLIATGIAEHSTFRGSASEAAARLRHTVWAMLSLTFGDDERRSQALARIRAIHRTVHGTLQQRAGAFSAGSRYSAEDPALLLWVHATVLDSNAEVYQHVVRPLTLQELDALCDHSAPFLVELGGDELTVPRTWKALRAHIDTVERSGVLAVTPAARAVADRVLWPTAGRRPVPFTGLQRLLTIGLLPEWLRSAYGYIWDDTRQARLTSALRLIRAARRVMPDRLALWRDAR